MFIVYIPVFIELLGDLVQVVSLPLQLRINFFDPIRIYDLFLRECFNDVLLLALPRLLHLFLICASSSSLTRITICFGLVLFIAPPPDKYRVPPGTYLRR